jgi:hypothetical protein
VRKITFVARLRRGCARRSLQTNRSIFTSYSSAFHTFSRRFAAFTSNSLASNRAGGRRVRLYAFAIEGRHAHNKQTTNSNKQAKQRHRRNYRRNSLTRETTSTLSTALSANIDHQAPILCRTKEVAPRLLAFTLLALLLLHSLLLLLLLLLLFTMIVLSSSTKTSSVTITLSSQESNTIQTINPPKK